MKSVPRYRIGNDLTVLWAIHNRDNTPFDMNDKVVKLYVTNDRGREEVGISLTSLPDGTVNNVLRWDFKGEKQRVLGKYTLTVSILSSTNNREILKDYCEAFYLVSLSDSEDADEGDVNISVGGDIILSSKLDIYRIEATNVDVSALREAIYNVGKGVESNRETIDANRETIDGLSGSINTLAAYVEELETRVLILEKGTGNDSENSGGGNYWTLEDGILKTTYPIFSAGFAAGATAESTSGGSGLVLDKESIVTALGYTPYDSSNPNGYITSEALSGYATEQYVASQIAKIDLSGYAKKTEMDAADNALRERLTLLESYWTLEDGILKTTYPIFSAGFAASQTATSDGLSGSGMTSILVDGVSYTPDELGVVDLSSAFESIDLSGYATLTALSEGLAGKQDAISDLATIRSNASNGATAYGWGNHANAGYAKTADVASTYATKAALSSLQSSHDTLRSEFDALESLLNDDTTGVINTWNEVVDFLNEYSGSEDLATILSGINADIAKRALQTDLTALATKVTTAEGNIASLASGKADKATTLAGYGITDAYTKSDVDGKVTAINNTLTSHDTRIKALEGYWYVEDGVLKTTYPILSASYAAAQTATSSGEGGGVVLDKASIITALGYTPYDSANPSGYITSSAIPTSLKNPYPLTFGSKTYDGSAAQTITAADLGALTSHQSVTNTGNTLSFGSAIIIGSVGGTNLTAALPSVASVKTTLGLGSLAYLNSLSKSDVGLGNVENTALSTWAGTSKITTLGTITTGTWNGSKIANNYLANSAITIAGTSVSLGGSITADTLQSSLGLGSLAYKSSLAFSELTSKPTTISGYGITDAYSASTIDSKLSGYLPLSGGTMTGSISLINKASIIHKTSTSSNSVNSIVWYYGDEADTEHTYQPALGWHNIGDTYGAAYIVPFPSDVPLWWGTVGLYISKSRLLYNNKTVLCSDNYTSYITKSYVDGLGIAATSATKLATARTIWGQSFDGTGDVSGLISSYSPTGSDAGMDAKNDSYSLFFGVGTSVNRGIYDRTNNGWLLYRDSTTNVLIPSGNVGIGTASPAYKLDVAGTMRATGAVTLASTLSVTGTSTFTGKTTHNGGIGATSGTFSSALSVGTTLSVTGATTLSSTLAVGGAATFNSLITASAGIKIGDATLSYDSTNGVLKVDTPLMSTGYTAGATAASDGDINDSEVLTLILTASSSGKSFTAEEFDSAGLTSSVISRLKEGKYTSIIIKGSSTATTYNVFHSFDVYVGSTQILICCGLMDYVNDGITQYQITINNEDGSGIVTLYEY